MSDVLFSSYDWELTFSMHYMFAQRMGVKCTLSRVNGVWEVKGRRTHA